MTCDTPPPIRTAPIALWRVMQALLGTLYTLFGAPEDVAREHTFTTKAHAHLASWLRSAEALLRRLLLIEASAHPKPNTRPLLMPSRRRERRLMSFTPDAPQDWRVSFRVFATADRRLPAGIPASQRAQAGDTRNTECRLEAGGPQRFYSAWPLAERYEALIRVFNDPTAYARRLARNLHATPHRVCEVLRIDKDAPHRIDRFEDIRDLCEDVRRRRFSSA